MESESDPEEGDLDLCLLREACSPDPEAVDFGVELSSELPPLPDFIPTSSLLSAILKTWQYLKISKSNFTQCTKLTNTVLHQYIDELSQHIDI